MTDQNYDVDPGMPKGGGDNGAPIDMPVTRHGEDFVKDRDQNDSASTTQPAGQGS